MAENLEQVVARLNAQMPLMRIELSKLHTKVDAIDASQRRSDVLLEDVEGKFKVTLAGYMDLGRRMDALEERMGKLEVRMDKLEARIDRLEARMDILDRDMKEGFEMVLRKMDELIGGRPSEAAA